MKKILTLLVAVIITSTACKAQEIVSSEDWSGKINAGMQKLGVCFSINITSDGEQICTMDILEQGAKGIPVELIKNDTDSLRLSIPSLYASYEGRKVSQESIEGNFIQRGFNLPLNLKPGKLELKRPQTPEPPFSYTTEEVVFKNEAEGSVLSGTLTYPVNYKNSSKNTTPVVLMVTGSGSQNRDEEIFGHKPFLVIADFLAKNGIASLRYDDRGFGKSTGSTDGITTANYFADAEAGIAYLRSLNKFGKIGVLGHSEGGTIAFMMGANKSVDFLISLAGGTAKGIDILVGQIEARLMQGGSVKLANDCAIILRNAYSDKIEGKEIADYKQYIEEVCVKNELTLPENLKTILESYILIAEDEWTHWFLAYNPADAIKKVTCPVMTVNGNLDLQVLSKDNIPAIKENLPKKRKNLIKEYDGLNHLLQHCTIATALTYGAIEETISEEVLNDIVNWVNSIK